MYNSPLITKTINGNDTISDTLVFSVNNLSTCQLILQFDSSSCFCDYDVILMDDIQLINAGNDTFVCSNATIEIGGDSADTYSYLWSGNNPGASFGDPTKSKTTYIPNESLTDTIDTVYLTTTKTDSCISIDTLVIQVYKKPIVGIIQDTTICKEVPIQLYASGGDTYLWNTTETTSSITVAPSFDQSYQVTITDTNLCSIDTSVNITVIQSITGVLVDSVYPYCVTKGSLYVVGVPGGTYQYSITNDSTGYQSSNSFTGLDAGVYVVYAKDLTYPQCIVKSSSPITLLDTVPPLTIDTLSFSPMRECGGNIQLGTINTKVSGGKGLITYSLTGSYTTTNTTGNFVNLSQGTYTVKASDSTGCPIDILTDFTLPKYSCDTIITPDTVNCVDTTEILNGVDSILTCDGGSTTSNGGSVVIDPVTGCVTTSPVFGSGTADTTCIVVCDSVLGVWVCDTTIIINIKRPVPDTIVTLLPSVGGVVVCADTSELIGDSFSYSSCRGATAGIFNRGSANCYTYIPLLKQIDTTCVIVCDEYNVCDTTYFVFIPSLTEDTVITTDTVVCVDTTEMPGGYHTVTGCDGNSPTTSRGGGTVTIDPLTGCVTISPSFGVGKTDTTCIIVCDTLNNICDTTIIVTVKPTTPDTIVQFTGGNPTDTCLTTSELLGTSLTYTSCRAATNGVLTHTDTCYNYIPIVRAMDTACVIICDEYGICDTTILIYVPPVTPDTVVTVDTVVCVDTTEMPNGVHHTITTCDGGTTSSGGGTVTIDPITGCVTTSPSFGTGNTDTTCIIVCDTVIGICDTTLIVTVNPPTTDTVVQLTNGMTTDSCITASELVGTSLTYTSCGAPSYGTMTNVDTCYKYVPTTNQLDTACTIICDEYGICDTTIFIYIPPVTPDTVVTTDTVVCVDTTQVPGGIGTITTCDGGTTTSGGGTVTIDPITGCVTTSPSFGTGNTDTTCIIVCNTVAGLTVCDTTVIVTVKPTTPDTIVQYTEGNPTDTCLLTSELVGTMYTYTSCGNPIHGTLTNNSDTCFNYTPITNTLDTACVVICDEYGICDTTLIIYVPPVTPDTLVTVDTVVCVDTTQMPNGVHHTITTCDGGTTTRGGGTVTIDPITGCVTTSPSFGTGLTDTTCIIVCDTLLGICDTTIIVTVKPPTTDTVVQLTNGITTDSCITASELVGTSLTYTSCEAPSYGTLTNVDTCYKYVPTTNQLDTACTIICDEYGICDTTIFIYIPPVTPDTVVTTDTVVCVDTTQVPGGIGTITTCDGGTTSSGGGTVTIDPITGCVTTSPSFGTGNTDTTCIVICNTVAGLTVCDTTVIVTVKPPTTDTVVQLTNGMTTDSCITASELVGTSLTYTSCGAPSYGTLTNVDTCYKYVPTTNQLDTACTIICDEYGICDTTIFIYIPPVTPDTIVTTDTVVCVDTTEIPGGVGTITTCDGGTTTSGGGTVTIDPVTGCVTTSPSFGTGLTDTTCIIVCNTIIGVTICDTTIIVTVKPPTTDTVVQLTNGMTTDSCITASELLGTSLTYTSCGAPSYGTMTNVDTCYKYVPTTNQLDTACTIICDEYGICDTTIFIYIPPVTPDTVVTTDTVVCVDTTEIPGGVGTITGCDGNSPTTTSNGGTATIDPLTGCVTTSPSFGTGLTDTTCIIVCKTIVGVTICDTTIIVTVKPPTPDTVVQLTNGMTTDSCITASELIGRSLTYTSCGAPSYGTMTNVDTCYKYVPTTNQLDTACTIICDEYGICDTTIFIYIPPVTPDTVVTTDTVVCVDTTEIPGGVGTITGCDGNSPTTTSNGGTATIDPLTGCVTTSPSFGTGLTDTTCIIVCKTIVGVTICDTTIIVTVKPPTPDTIIQLTNGNPTDTCLTQSDLPGTRYTYTSCGNPIHGVLTNNSDTCFNYTPITNTLDTSCVVICDEHGICDTTLFIYVPPVTIDTIYSRDTVVCVDTTEMPDGYDVATGCDGNNPTMSNGGGTVTVDAQGCVTISPSFNGGKTDTTCIIICDTVFGLCDTTIIITMRRAIPDTIYQCIPRDGQANDSAMNTNDLLGPVVTTSTFTLPKHGQFTLTNDTNTSYQTSPFPILDTVQVSFCDQYNFCDTFTFIYIPPMTVDTIYTQGSGTVCVDTSEMPARRYTSLRTCDGMNMTSNGGTAIPSSGACVTITPDFSSGITDTTCIILCDTILPMCECDTTLIVSFRPTVPDTFAIQLPKGTNTADTCLTTSELFGTRYTYRRLGAPAPHGPVTNHNDTCINYVQTSTTKYLDTARVLICDEYGNCDTTIIIYVPTPDPDTLLVGPVIPVTNVDTCATLESSYMVGMYINTCDSTGTSSGGVPVTITGLCVRYPVPAPVFTGDTVCLIVCDSIRNVTICDTTMIVYLPDTTPPTVICKDDTVYLNNLGTVMIDTSNVLDTVYDNTLVNAVWLTPTTFNCSNVGPNSVTLYARDTNRNIDSCISTVTVLDTLPPTAICQNITIQLDSNGNASIVAIQVDGGSFDNCGIASFTIDKTSFDCSNLGVNTVTLTVTDIYGNSSTCTSTVTVEDNISPITYCPGDKQRIVRNTTCEYIVEDFVSEASAWDNCSVNGVTFTQSPAAGTSVILENTSQTITITATDASGNTSTCTFEVYARCVKELNIPQFISPDGNGQNDTWELPELANYPNNTVKVFNRWGNLVFEEKGYSTGWNGTSNVDQGVNRLMDNKMLPEGTYFCIIDLGTNDLEPYVGYMQIKR